MKFQSPSGRTYEWTKPQPPTEKEWEELVAYDASVSAAADGKALVTRNGPVGSVFNDEISNTIRGIGLETGGAILGGLAGSLFGGPVGIALGAVAGGAAGNYVKQLFDVSEGRQDDVKSGEVLAAGVLSAPPAAVVGKLFHSGKAGMTVWKTAMLRATQGGMAAASADTVRTLVDEGKLPTWEEVGTQALAGAAFGGAIGGVEGRYVLKGGFITNKLAANAAQLTTLIGTTAYTYNDEVAKGNSNPLPTAVGYGLAAYGATHVPSKLMGLNKDKLRHAIAGPEVIVGKATKIAANEFQDQLKAAAGQGTDLGNLINDEIKKSKDPAALLAQTIAVMDKTASRATLPTNLQKYVAEYESVVADNAKEILARYRNLDPEIRKEIAKQAGGYLRTAYAAHDPRAVRGKDWDAPGTFDAARKKIRDGIIASSGGKKTLDEASKEADAMMARMANDVAFMASGEANLRIGGTKSPTSITQHKHDLPLEVRQWLGEVKDPGKRVQQTLSAQSRLVFHHEHDKNVRKILTGSGIASKELKPGYVKLVEADDPVLHRELADLYVPKEWADAWKEVMDPNLIGDGLFARTLMKATTVTKALKTVGNTLEAIAPQAWGNLALAMSSGKFSTRFIYDGLRFAAKDARSLISEKSADANIKMARELRKLRSLGVIQGGAEIQELRSLMGMSLKESDPEKWLQKASKVYGMPDAAVRYALYRHNLEEISKFNLGLGTDDLERMAARLTKDHFPTYDLIPRRLRQASAVSVANTFGAFEFEVARNYANQLRYGVNLLYTGMKRSLDKGASPSEIGGGRNMVIAATKRITGLISVSAGTAAAGVTASQWLGTTEQDQKDIATLLPQFAADRANLIKINGKDGTFSYTPINYLLPYSNMANAIQTALVGENPVPKVKSIIFGDDLGPLVTPAVEAITNTYYGTDVPISEPRSNRELIERSLTKAFLPQVVSGTASRIEKSLRGDVSKLGNVYKLEDQGLRFLGVRQQTIDILKSATSRIRSAVDPINGEVTGYRRVITNNYNPTTKQFERIDEDAIYRERARRYEIGQRELAEQYMALKRLAERTDGKITDNDIIGAFRQAGVSNKLIAGAVFGYTVPMPRGIAQTTSEVVADALSTEAGKRDPISALRARSGGDPMRLRQLVGAYKEARINDARGGDSLTKLFGGLTTSDGERADAIYRAMVARPELADKLRDKLLKTRVITPEVYRQLILRSREGATQ